MTPADLLLRLRDLKVRVWVDAGKLRLDPESSVPADLADALRAREGELVGLLQSLAPAQASAQPAAQIPRIDRTDDIPLSFAQQRFWFLGQLGEASAAYNMALALRLRGALDVDALAWSLAEITRRHAILRTTIHNVDGSPQQRIGSEAAGALEVVDLSAEADLDAEIGRRVDAELERPFDLETGPLHAFVLLACGAEHHVLLATMHHIISDHLSYGVLVNELSQLYAARLRQQPANLPELPIQYADYTCWQRDWYEQASAKLLPYWKEQLAELPTLELPTDRPRPTTQSFRGGKLSFEIPDAVVAGLRSLSVQENCTFFMTTLTAFKVLIARYTGQDSIVVGTPVANRDKVEIEPLIGLFLNSLVLRTDLSGNPTFRELMGRVRKTALGAYQHQDMPFEQLVVELRPDRDLSRNPLFQVLFNLLSEKPPVTLGGIEVEELEPDSVTAKFDLTLALAEGERGVQGIFEFNRDLFDPETIERMQQHLLLLLTVLAEQPDSKILDVSVLTAAEKQLTQVAKNDTARDYPRDLPFYALFEQQVDKTPDAIAATCGTDSLTYAELNARANKMARVLRERGARPDTLIGVNLERSLDMLVALLAIQKSGAAYVPLDPSYPAERIAFIADDANIELMVSTEPGSDYPFLRPDDPAIAAQDDGNLEPASGPEHLAYVIFTSGSTGKPKGVQIEHRALVNFLSTMAERPGLTADDVLVAVTTISFDIAGLELYLPLLVGARIELATDEVATDGRELAAMLERATIMQATPATWRLLLEVDWDGAGRVTALCGGEALPRDLAEQLLPRCKELWNMYGPTETTIWSLTGRVRSGEGPVDIGDPIANTQIFVLDRNHRPVPIGVPGHLFLGGDGLARGYWNRDELTAEKFIPHPIAGESGRLYDTGDLARFRADGSLEFLGRIDNQVKIRGYRIELGEIEAVLDRHDAVKECAVVAQTKQTGDRQLVAHAVLHPGASATVSELRKHVRASLPDYMVPPAFVMLDELPLTPNGKVDRKALARKSSTRVATERSQPPQSEMEIFVANVWKEVLGIDQVGLKDNFFDLGGHSLLAMRVIFRMEKETGQKFFPIELLLQTLEQFAALCDQRRGGAKAPEPQERAPAGGGLFGRLRDKLRGAKK